MFTFKHLCIHTSFTKFVLYFIRIFLCICKWVFMFKNVMPKSVHINPVWTHYIYKSTYLYIYIHILNMLPMKYQIGSGINIYIYIFLITFSSLNHTQENQLQHGIEHENYIKFTWLILWRCLSVIGNELSLPQPPSSLPTLAPFPISPTNLTKQCFLMWTTWFKIFNRQPQLLLCAKISALSSVTNLPKLVPPNPIPVMM